MYIGAPPFRAHTPHTTETLLVQHKIVTRFAKPPAMRLLCMHSVFHRHTAPQAPNPAQSCHAEVRHAAGYVGNVHDVDARHSRPSRLQSQMLSLRHVGHMAMWLGLKRHVHSLAR